MNTELIAETWESVDDHLAFVEALYQRFFERFPAYRPLFPKKLDPRHLDKMVETLALLARLSEDRSTIAPHVRKLGDSHKPYALKDKDMGNFRAVFLETLEEHAGAAWSPAAETAWREAIDQVLIPMMREGTTA